WYNGSAGSSPVSIAGSMPVVSRSDPRFVMASSSGTDQSRDGSDRRFGTPVSPGGPYNVMPSRSSARQLRLAIAVVVALSLFLPIVPSARADGPAVRFGIDEGYGAPDLFSQSGASWDRVDFHWDAYQPNGPTDWLGTSDAIDAGVARDLASGKSVVGVITNPPAWATRNGSVPSNLNLPATDPQNYWASFVHRLASSYAGKIDSWIIWNEPDIDPSRPMSSWAGSEDEFYKLLKDADLAIKSANPGATVVFAGTTYWNDVL